MTNDDVSDVNEINPPEGKASNIGGLKEEPVIEGEEDKEISKPEEEMPKGEVETSTFKGNLEEDALPEEGEEDAIAEEKVEALETTGITAEQKAELKEQSGWSNEIIDSLRSLEEAEIYQEAGLKQEKIGEKYALAKEIDFDSPDEFGVTNRQRIDSGHSPVDADGNTIYVHHIGQHKDSPFAELTYKEHMQDGHNAILHPKREESEVHGAGSHWDSERMAYWSARLEEYDS
ncbi:MAG: HNH/ENDO VII family nuclease [Clostridiales bacterium]|nr:HNH/ENDO VII family nuclease [Clostridiales bacterium]